LNDARQPMHSNASHRAQFEQDGSHTKVRRLRKARPNNPKPRDA